MEMLHCVLYLILILTKVSVSLRNQWKIKLPGIGEINKKKQTNS